MGSTGSIGTQTLEVIGAESPHYEVSALGAASSVELLAKQALEVRPEVVALADESGYSRLVELVGSVSEVICGPEALAAACEGADVVVNGVVGFAGLGVTLASVRDGRRLALANKESLISAGPVVRAERSDRAEIIPVDSEHCAIHQCLRAGEVEGRRGPISRILLTASGGPFRGRKREDLIDVTVEEALAHPTWSMGPKITVDSSTLMNKGLEVIEAHELFDIDVDDVEVVVHPQSVVHSMVEFSDGAVIAQLSLPDMRLPIGYALAYPNRIGTPFGRIDWARLGMLEFETPDLETFECLALAFEAGRVGGTAPAWLNAANEVAVGAFLDGRITWIQIAEVLKACMDRHDGTPATTADVVMEVDRRSRATARDVLDSLG